MNYQALKTMIESLIKSYKCPECSSSISDTNVDIIWAAWNNVNIDIECPKCKKHSIVKSQVIQMNVGNLWQLKDNLLNLKNNIWKPRLNVKHKTIKDKEIIDLSKDLKNDKLNASDLFGK